MPLNERGRTFESGKALSNDLRRSIIDEVVLAGGNIVTGYFPGTYQAVATKFRVARSTVRKVWKNFCDDYVETAMPSGGPNRNRDKLTGEDLELIEALKIQRGSISLSEICEELEALGLQENISASTISRAIKNKMPSGKRYSRKKITHLAKERFTPENMLYTQLFINYVSSKDPYTLKFFDEAGVRIPEVGTRLYGDSPVGERCVEVTRKCPSPNHTLNALTSLYDGVAYFSILDGPTNTAEFLNFFDEVCQSTSPTTERPLLEIGDTVIMDNLSCHHFEGGEILEDIFNDMGIELLYTPVYSPDLNPVEHVFAKVKNALNFDLLPVVHYDNKMAIYEANGLISSSDVHGFYKNTDYLFV